jgi:phosphoribosyl 1,2-cyclic phosphate phosphodiesterase
VSVLKATILGCGSSGGVPRLGGADGAGDWGACDPKEPKNRRSRCSILFERRNTEEGAPTVVLIDTSPDLRTQLLAARCKRLDAVLITHDHADQTHGLDDLRALALSNRARIPVYIDDETGGEVVRRFSYCFEEKPGTWYPPILLRRALPTAGTPFLLEGPGGAIAATPFLQGHGPVNSLGFRVGDFAYTSDAVSISETGFDVLKGVKVWVVDALQRKPHGTHSHLDQTLAWISRVKPHRAILTNLHVSMDYKTLRNELPPGVEPAFDGLSIELPS